MDPRPARAQHAPQRRIDGPERGTWGCLLDRDLAPAERKAPHRALHRREQGIGTQQGVETGQTSEGQGGIVVHAGLFGQVGGLCQRLVPQRVFGMGWTVGPEASGQSDGLRGVGERFPRMMAELSADRIGCISKLSRNIKILSRMGGK